MGYHRAGFDVTGVDIEPQPHYPFEFHQADAMTFSLEGFDVIHASPPCQAYSQATPAARREAHPDLIATVRERLIDTGNAYVIENVPGAEAQLIEPVLLCGTMFGLRVRRHRLFECPGVAMLCPPCNHWRQTLDVSGTGGNRVNRRAGDHGGNLNRPRNVQEAGEVMGIDWMTRYEISQAIPPAYTFFVGSQLLQALERVA